MKKLFKEFKVTIFSVALSLLLIAVMVGLPYCFSKEAKATPCSNCTCTVYHPNGNRYTKAGPDCHRACRRAKKDCNWWNKDGRCGPCRCLVD